MSGSLPVLALRLLPLLAYLLLYQVVLAGSAGSPMQAGAGALHALILAGPALWRQRELRQHYRLLLLATVATAALACYQHGWPLAFWLCALAGVGLNSILGGAATLSRLTGTLQVLFLLLLLFFFLLPDLLGSAAAPGWPDLRALLWVAYGAWALAYVLSLRDPSRPPPEPIICALFTLLLALVSLGVALSYVRVPDADYLRVLLATFTIAMAASAAAWVLWSPSIGGGLSTIFFRHVLSLNVPIEEWMQEMTDLAGATADATDFWQQAMERLLERTGLVGVGWDEGSEHKLAGSDEGRLAQLPLGEATLCLYSARAITPTRLFSLWLLARVASEFRQSKEREQRLTAEATMKSVHELGARTTHDIKNILHAINLLCARGGEQGEDAFPARQKERLLALSKRLEESLGQLKGESLAMANQGRMPLKQWWEGARRRVPSAQVEFRCALELGDDEPTIPAELFDRALENLTHNALRKQGIEGEVKVVVELLEGPALVVRDNGSEIPEAVHKRMFNAPLPSSAGMGIGLYQLALNAAREKYQIYVDANEEGDVAFKLEKE